MRRLHLVNAGLSTLLLLSTAAHLYAVTPDPKLLALVPATAQIVAGMNIPPRSGQPSTFMLSTHDGTIDLNDFIAISGVDASRAFDQIIMVASDGEGGANSAHSLMAIGRFNQNLIYQSARQSGANSTRYHGIAVLEVPPFARERDSFHEVRWLAMMDSKLAVFGTIGLVQQELDRYLARARVDSSLARRLARLRHDDATWCVSTLPERDGEIRSIFRMLDSRFSELLQGGDTIQFGIHYGRQVEFEYEIGTTSGMPAERVEKYLAKPTTNPEGASQFPTAAFIRVEGGLRGVLKVPKDRYEAWLVESVENARLREAAATGKR